MRLEARSRLDRDTRREAILDVAAEVFLEEGFAAASMSAIAARLGGSKGTLYNYFKSKEVLFDAHVRRHCAWLHGEMFDPIVESAEVRPALTSLGHALLRHMLSDVSLRNFRVITAEAERTPEIGKAFYEAGPLSGAKRLALHLADAAHAGWLRLDDPLAAAHQFIGLCQNRMLKARLCGVMGEPTAEEIDQEVAAAVDSFMAAFGAPA
jgi:AcrR family transcriptional regulator